ncbi:MAG TPA: ComEC/Rec2 family competence protein [Candidatus Saccharimonadales bacterium]|nr:ComEC/Rec2 family competence protein [Candidatus Saccharimonadales bacterium]
MDSWHSRRATQITLVTLALLIGVVAGRLWLSQANLLITGVALAAFAGLRFRLGLLVTLVFIFGIWRGNTTVFTHTPLGRELGRTVTVTGIISDDPAVNAKNQVSFTLGNVRLNGRAVHQNIQMLTNFKTLQRGYHIQATGKLELGLGSAPAAMGFAVTTVTSTHTSQLEQFRQRFFTAMRAVLPEPLSGFGLGLLIGVRALIDKSLQQTLNAVGLSHLIAVSGYNLTIIIQAARRLVAPVSTFMATATSLWLIFGFLLVAGFGASVVRAAIVSSLSLIVAYYGYEAKPITLVALPALLTVAWRPDYLLQDVGWQLSFLAFFGIMVLAPLLQQRFVRRPTPIKLLVIESLAAQITTAPLILATFGNFSIISPLSNAVILPMVPLAMLLSFGAGMAGIAVPVLAGWVALPAAGLLALMIGLVQWFASLPDANLQLSATPVMIIGMYGLILLGTLVLWRGVAHPPQAPHKTNV